MFKKSNDAMDQTREKAIGTIIGEMAKLEGNFVSDSGALIKGNIEGEIEVNGRLVIGETAKVKAQVQAEEVIVEGELEGNVSSDGDVTISDTGKLVGDVTLGGNLVIEPGAVFIGASRMQKKERDDDLADVDISDDGTDDLDLD